VDLSLFFVGTGGAVPSARRGLPAVLLMRGGERVLFDCGEGTQRQLVRSVGLVDLDRVFLTHYHADHWLGLPGMLKSYALRERERPLTLYGPAGLERLIAAMGVAIGRLPYELVTRELERWEEVECDGYVVAAVPVVHGEHSAVGYSIVEAPRPGEFNVRAAEELGVTPGADYGRLARGETVGGVTPEQVLGPPREGRKLVISGDTIPCEALAVAAHRADVLVHEATFGQELVDSRSASAGPLTHSTARQAAELAREAEVRMLALVHVSGRYSGGELRDEARAVFAATEVPRDFDAIEVPFPERSGPRLVRWSERRAREQPAGEDAQEGRGGRSDAPGEPGEKLAQSAEARS
jgi:ribonuclease Z